MALTRAQLLMGNAAQGIVLPGQVQAVKQGPGISIAPDGTISVDSQTVVGLMKMGQTLSTATAAYNRYEWPLGPGNPGMVVKIDSILGGVTKLKWDTAGGFTTKGQLLVGTGPGTDTLLNVGLNGSILIADSTTASGLNYTSNYVATTSAQGAANIPAGFTSQRPSAPALGAFRFNDTLDALEFWNGSAWEIVASSDVNGFVEKTSDTGSAIIPSGSTAQRDTSPIPGFFRYNNTTGNLEYYDGVIWKSVSASATGSFVAQSVPNAGTPSAEIPVGSTAQRQSFPSTGFLRYNSDIQALEVWNGTTWDNTSGEVNTLSFGTTGLIPNTPTVGDIVVSGILNITNGGTNADNAVQALNNLLPVQTGNNGFYFVTNGTQPSWQAPPAMVNTFSAGVTGFNPSVATSGIVTLTGTLNLQSGGTGATTQQGAANAILPAQGGNSGRFLSTDGSNVVWSPISPAVNSFSAGVTGFTPAVNTTGAIVLGGTLNIASGGTNATTRNVALNNLLPAQGGSGSYVLTTNGTDASWQPGGGGGGGVTQLVAGTNVTISPVGGTGIVTINASGSGGLTAATLIEAQAGTLTTVAATPQTAVPKDASGMTGAAILPGGTTAQRPGTPGDGYIRYNQDREAAPGVNPLEVYAFSGTTSAGWFPIVLQTPGASLTDLNVPASTTLTLSTSTLIYNNINIAGTLNIGSSVTLKAEGSVNITGTINGAGTGALGATSIQISTGATEFFPSTPGRGFGGGSAGRATSSAQLQTSYPPTTLFSSGGACGDASTTAPGGTVTSGEGGSGGGTLQIIAKGPIVFSGSAQLQGSAGGNAAVNLGAVAGAGGGGGGSGGCFFLQSETSLTISGSINVSGGNGGLPDFTTGAGFSGGGGGGGGWVVIQGGSVTFTATVNKAGGTNGTPNSALFLAGVGGTGGGFGGSSGQSGVSPYLFIDTPGGAGVQLINGVIS